MLFGALVFNNTAIFAQDNCDLKPWSYVTVDNACDSFIWQGNIYRQSRSRGQACEVVGRWAEDGCDSIACLILTLHLSVRDTQDEVRYGCGSLSFNGIEYTESGWAKETKRGVAADGCDSIYYFPLEILPGNASFDTSISGCNAVEFAGQTYTSDTSWSDTISIGVCDSVSSVSIMVQEAIHTTFTTEACDQYLWGGKVFYSDTVGPTATFTSHLGCDSVVAINLTMHYAQSGDTTAVVCDSVSWYGVTYYGGTPTHVFRNATIHGCDSTLRLNMVMHHDTHADTSAEACDSFYWHGQMLYASSDVIAADQFAKNAQGCDSTLMLHLVINKSVSSDSAVVGCNSVFWKDSVYFTETIAETHRYEGDYGCDSVVNIRIVLLDNHPAHDTAIACGYYIWHYTKYTETGVYSYHTFNSIGCDSVTYLHLTLFPQGEGELSGAFEVEAGEEVEYDDEDHLDTDNGEEALKKYNGRYVAFSQGNLQFMPSTSKWRFAEHQFDFMGQGNRYASADYAGWLDLFGWGTSGYHNSSDVHNTVYQPWATNNENVDYQYNAKGYGPSVDMSELDFSNMASNYDWGIRNPISNGENKAGIWRTMTADEWTHLLFHRRNAANKRAQASITDISGAVTVRGVVLLPESWVQPDNSTFTPGSDNGFSTNIYTIEQWQTMQTHGAAFLPAAGNRFMYIASGEDEYGYYWSATHYDSESAYLFVLTDVAMSVEAYPRHVGRSVRLVQDVAETRSCTVYVDTTVRVDSIFVWRGEELVEAGDYQYQYDTEITNECDSIVTIHLSIGQVGINTVLLDRSTILTQGRDIVVRGADNQQVCLFDMQGRLLNSNFAATGSCSFAAPAAGIYLIRVGQYPARKVIVR